MTYFDVNFREFDIIKQKRRQYEQKLDFNWFNWCFDEWMRR